MTSVRGRALTALPFVLLAALAVALPRGAAAVGSCKDLQAATKPRYKNCRVLTEGKAALLWRTAGKGGVDVQLRLVVKASEKELGWMGIGFSDMGSMAGE